MGNSISQRTTKEEGGGEVIWHISQKQRWQRQEKWAAFDLFELL